MNLAVKVLLGTLMGAVAGAGVATYFLLPAKPQPLTKVSWESFINGKKHKNCWNLLSVENKQSLLFVCSEQQKMSLESEEKYYFWNGINWVEQVIRLTNDPSGKKVKITDSDKREVGKVGNNSVSDIDKNWTILVERCHAPEFEEEFKNLECEIEEAEESSDILSISLPLTKFEDSTLGK